MLSIGKLSELFGNNAKLARVVLDMTRDELLETKEGHARFMQCYSAPSTLDLRLHVLDELAGTHGIEGFWLKDGTHCAYLNAGDTYDLTLCFYHGKFRLCSWGDVAEKFGGE